MPYAPVTTEAMAAQHPDLFRISQPRPDTTFAEQHAAALAAFNAPGGSHSPAAMAEMHASGQSVMSAYPSGC